MLFNKRIIGLDGCELLRTVERTSALFAEAMTTSPQSCPHCQSSLHRIKSTETRKIRHAFFDGRILFVDIKVRKRLCLSCSRYFRDRVPGLMPRFRVSESLKNFVFTNHEHGICGKILGKMLRASESSIGRWIDERLERRMKEIAVRHKQIPRKIGIDEHFFTRKVGFATTLIDLDKKQIFDVVKGRTEVSLDRYLSSLEGRDEVELVVMDLSDNYRQIVQKYFPNAQIVSDRFHVIRLVFHHFQKVWHQLDPQVKWKRGLGKLFRMHPKNLDAMQTLKLQSYLDANPAIHAIYDKRTEVCNLLLKKDQQGFAIRKNVKTFFSLTNELKESNFASLNTLAETMLSWQVEIARMWHVNRNNGITEGFHNKMEVISRRAYGYRNFKNYRKRVLAMSGWDGMFATRRPRRYPKLQI